MMLTVYSQMLLTISTKEEFTFPPYTNSLNPDSGMKYGITCTMNLTKNCKKEPRAREMNICFHPLTTITQPFVTVPEVGLF